MKTGSVATVKGDYLYYHYKQDGMDDDVRYCVFYTTYMLILLSPLAGLGLFLSVTTDSLVVVLAARLH